MSSRWKAGKIGLINFWYYDDQEFPFVKGRMLLRGSNGSGKSVTMQSVVPLLLDGNMSPERLDPFGSRDRKMSSYLLEEDDEREERTGYLYLEFKRESSETYMTIGMGIRARRGKPLDKWYFSLTDGRRIGKDFFLYKETGERVTLSKKELQNRVGDGGLVFDRQQDYMEYVNRQIFGFETVDEYREMIDLLIQLRTPKLSKDFKPTVINDILSDSLQQLSDDDLRPMSEAIENMDTMTLNLKSRKEARAAAGKINTVYSRYNRLVLYKKLSAFWQADKILSDSRREEKQRQQQLADRQQEIRQLEEQQQELDARHASMEKERDSLSKSDAVALKSRETQLMEARKQLEQSLAEKENFLQSKREQYTENEERQKREEDRKYLKEKEIDDLLEEMQAEADDMAFEEHGFLQEELKAKMDEPYKYDLHQKQYEDTKEKIRQCLELLREADRLERDNDRLLEQRERHLKQLDAAQRRVTEIDRAFVQVKNEWKENLYQWNKENRELILEKELLGRFSIFADEYGAESDFARVRQLAAEVWIHRNTELETVISENRRERKALQEEQAQVETELVEWEAQKEPEPVRTEAVIKNRERLKQLQIPCQEFYKVIEFGDSLSAKDCGRLEEALLEMGILDALVIDEQYRSAALAAAEGCADKYLFVRGERPKKSLLDVLELNQDVNDIFNNQRLTGILSHIAYGEDAETAIAADGTYQLGILTGTITGEHEAEFLGTQARERSRQAKITACRERLTELGQFLEKNEAAHSALQERRTCLRQEYDALPDDGTLRETYRRLEAAEHLCEQMEEERKRLEEQLREAAQNLYVQKKAALELAGKLYLTGDLATFQTADRAAGQYGIHLASLKAAHEIYRNSVRYLKDLAGRLEELETDMDQIRYDISTVKKELARNREEHTSIIEQLKLTDYEQIKQRLDECVSWLHRYPQKLQVCVQEKTKKQETVRRLIRQSEEETEKIAGYEKKREVLKQISDAELALEYVEIPEELAGDKAQICGWLENGMPSEDKETVIVNLNRVYFENRGFLADYQLQQEERFAGDDQGDPAAAALAKRLDITARYQGEKIPFFKLLQYLDEDIAQLADLIRDKDRELFEDILTNTVSRKIRGRINASNAWVSKMNSLMGAMNTSSGLRLNLRWRSKTAELEDQLDTKELVDLLKKDYRLMNEEEAAKLSAHFRSKVEEARRHASDSAGNVSFYQVMKETLDYRKWFEFQLFFQKSGERQKELTNSVFGTFSGGEKAMAMYVPLFSAVVAKYQGGREDAPRLISLDEAFAGVDNKNIRDMFRLMREFEFDFIINSQVLWGDCDTLDALAIYQLIRPENAKFVTVMPYLWNGRMKELLENEMQVETRGTQLG